MVKLLTIVRRQASMDVSAKWMQQQQGNWRHSNAVFQS